MKRACDGINIGIMPCYGLTLHLQANTHVARGSNINTCLLRRDSSLKLLKKIFSVC